MSHVSWSSQYPHSVFVCHSLICLWITWGCVLITLEVFMPPWSTLPQMSPRGHCEHWCHIKVLCIHEESVRGAEVLFTCLRKESFHQTENLRKFKGNVEKDTTETYHWKDFMSPSHGTSDKHFCHWPKTQSQGNSAEMRRHPGKGFSPIHSGLPLVSALLLFSEQWLAGCFHQ